MKGGDKANDSLSKNSSISTVNSFIYEDCTLSTQGDNSMDFAVPAAFATRISYSPHNRLQKWLLSNNEFLKFMPGMADLGKSIRKSRKHADEHNK